MICLLAPCIGTNDSIGGQNLLNESGGNLSVLGVIAPTVTGITPNSGLNSGPLSVTIDGTGFANGAKVMLTPVGYYRPWHKGAISNGQGGARLNQPRDVFVSGNYAYVTSANVNDLTGNALEIVDISDPANPRHVSSYADIVHVKDPGDVFVSGKYSYVVSTGTKEVAIIDVSDPTKPRYVNGIWEGLFNRRVPTGVFVSGKYAYVIYGSLYGLKIVDVSNPSNLIDKGFIEMGEGDAQKGGEADICVSGSYAYILDQPRNALLTVDVSNPNSARVTDRLDLTGLNYLNSVSIYGNYAYITYGRVSSGGIFLVDVSDPTNAILKGKFEKKGESDPFEGFPFDISVSGKHAYVTSGNGLEVVDFSDPSNPVHKGGIVNNEAGALLQGSTGVFVSGRYAYVASWHSNALEILDTGAVIGTDVRVASATQIDKCTFDLKDAAPVYYDVVVTNPDGSSGVLASGLRVVKSKPATEPTVTSITPNSGAINTFVTITDIKGKGFADGATVLLTPANVTPVQTGHIADNEGGARLKNPHGVFVSGNYAYVGSVNSHALEIVDVSDPAKPKHKGSIVDGEGGSNLGWAEYVFVSGDYAYVTSPSSSAFEIVNVKDPGSPKHAGSIQDGEGGARLSWPGCVFVSGNHAYVTSYFQNSLEIVDISNPTRPVHRNRIVNWDGGARLYKPWDVFVSGNYAYVTCVFQNTLEIVDVSDPAKPKHKGCIYDNEGSATLYYPKGIFVSGNYAYVASSESNALEIVDVSNPARPVHKGRIYNGEGGACLDHPWHVFVSGNYAYVSSRHSNALEIVDISDPASPRHKGSIELGDAGCVHVSGRYAYVSVPDKDILDIIDIGTVTGTDVHVNSGTQIRCAFDLTDINPGEYNVVVTNPDGAFGVLTNGFKVSKSPTAELTVTSIMPNAGVTNTLATVTSINGTEFIFGASAMLTPANGTPRNAGKIVEGEGGARMTDPKGVFVAGRYAYVTSSDNTLEIVDVSNPAKPVHVGNIVDNQGGARLSEARGVFVSGNLAYVASYDSDSLEIVDVSDPAKPAHKGSISNGQGGARLDSAFDVFVSGKYAYVVGTDFDSFEIVDVSDPAKPVHKGSLVNGDGGAKLKHPEKVFISGNHAYITASDSNALEIVDVSDPSNPKHDGSIADGEGGARLKGACSVFVAGPYAYVTGYKGGSLEIVDVSDPANPAHMGSIVSGEGGAQLGAARTVFVFGNYAYVGSPESNALEIIDVSDPARPVHKGSIGKTKGGKALDAYDVHVLGRYAYVTSPDTNTLEVIDTGTVTGTGVNVASSKQIDKCTFDLTGINRGRYNVVVTNPGGSFGVLAEGFEVKGELGCLWTSSSPVCNGTPVQFNGPSEMDSYSWNFGDGATSMAEDPSHAYAAPGTYTVNLTTTKDGSSKTCTGTVEVKSLPDCSWTSNSPVCYGTPVQFDGPSGMDRYLWTFGDSGPGSTAEDPSHTYRKAGTYTIKLTVVKGKVSKSCQGKVKIKPLSECI